MAEVKDPCTLRNKDARLSAMGQAVQCWRGECLICGWECDKRMQRRMDIRKNGLYEATDAEVDAYIAKYEGVLTRKAIECLYRFGLRYYKVRRAVETAE